MFDAYEVQSNPWGLPADTRGNWASGLGVPIVQTPEDMQALDYLFYVGSAESFDPRAQKIAVAFVKILKRAGVRVRHPRRARDVDRGMRAPRRQRDAVPAARAGAGRHAERVWASRAS